MCNPEQGFYQSTLDSHTQEIQNLINTALHAPATGSIVIQGALFLDIISRMENADKQNAELREQIKLLWDAYPNAEWREEFMSPREVEIFGSRLDDLLAIAKAGEVK